jgi:hypothetical protein
MNEDLEMMLKETVLYCVKSLARICLEEVNVTSKLLSQNNRHLDPALNSAKSAIRTIRS